MGSKNPRWFQLSPIHPPYVEALRLEIDSLRDANSRLQDDVESMSAVTRAVGGGGGGSQMGGSQMDRRTQAMMHGQMLMHDDGEMDNLNNRMGSAALWALSQSPGLLGPTAASKGGRSVGGGSSVGGASSAAAAHTTSAAIDLDLVATRCQLYRVRALMAKTILNSHLAKWRLQCFRPRRMREAARQALGRHLRRVVAACFRAWAQPPLDHQPAPSPDRDQGSGSSPRGSIRDAARSEDTAMAFRSSRDAKVCGGGGVYKLDPNP